MLNKIEGIKEIIKMQNENVERLGHEIQACLDQLEGLKTAFEAARARRSKFQEQLIHELEKEKA